MKLSAHDRHAALIKKVESVHPEGRPRGPNSALTMAEEAGLSPGGMRARLRRVERGEMTLEEAMTTPPMSRVQAGQAAAKKRWGMSK